MELILATANREEIAVVDYDFDLDIGLTGNSSNTFQVTLDYASWMEEITHGCLIYVPNTEYGGIVKDIKGSTQTDQITLQGYTWRGYLAKRIICPDAGQDYKIVSGELNSLINTFVSNDFGGLFVVSSDDTGQSVTNYQFNRYVPLSDGLQTMLQSVGYRLDIQYVQSDSGGNVVLSAVPVGSYGDEIELSQDSQLNFSSDDYQMGVNHLICLGTGELKDRIVVHLYADRNGNISRTQSITGLEEIVDKYDYSGAEEDTLIESGTQRLQTLINKKTFTATFASTDTLDLFVGDTISGRDYITGNIVTKPIVSKIVKRVGGLLSVNYKIEGGG